MEATRTSAVNPELNFDNFVIGKANRFAATSARALIKQPKSKHCPLYILGDCGSGKTHLASAIANLMTEVQPQAKIGFYHARNYERDIVRGFQKRRLDHIRKVHCTYDLFILDDFDLLADKPGTQQELLWIITELQAANKIVVVTGSVLPWKLETSGMNQRLLSLLSSGLLAMLKSPGTKLRTNILKQMAAQNGFALDHEVALYIAENVKPNIQVLQGALHRAHCYSQFHASDLSIATAKVSLGGLFSQM